MRHGADAMVAFNGDAHQVRFITGSSEGGGQGEEVVGLQVEETDGVNSPGPASRARWQGRRTSFAATSRCTIRSA